MFKKLRKNTKIQLLLTIVAITMIGLFVLMELSIIPKKFYTICPTGYERYKFCPPLNPKLAWCEYRCKKMNEEIDEPDLKPVIYLYPQHAMNIKVVLDYKGKIIADYPKYDNKIKGWEVKAYPDGRMINKTDGLEYSYLFWEGMPQEKIDYDLSNGFIVKSEDTRAFLRDILAKMGLTPKEYNEFIVYWYPLMKDNTYNLIHFAGEKYTNNAPLKITPAPDSILRVFMVYKALDKEIKIKKQIIKPFDRVGFSVIEWGGTQLK